MNPNELSIAILVTTIVIVALIVVVTLTVLIASRQRIQQKASLVAAELRYQQELRTIESETQEATLTHISQELHDNIGQLLTVTRLQIEKAQLQFPEFSKIVLPISDSLNAATQQLRLLSHSLNTDLLFDSGLSKAIEREIERLEKLGKYNIDFTRIDNQHLIITKDQQIILFRILQEILNNSLRHSGAKNVWINIGSKNGFLLTIADDGVGFDKENVLKSSKGIGLQNIFQRSKMAGFLCNLDSSPGGGCAYNFTLVDKN